MASRTERQVPLSNRRKRMQLMNTISKKLRAGALGLTLVATSVVALPVYAQVDSGTAPPRKASKQENVGVVTGLAVGAAAGGPVGAIIGAAAGGWLGDRYHKKAVANESLKADLGQSESQRTMLAQDVTTLNTSLVEARKKSDQL